MSLIIYNLIPLTAFPYIQRGLMCSNPRQVKSVFSRVGISVSLFALMNSTIGMVIAGLNPDIHGDEALFYFIDQTVPSSIMGFVAVSLLAIIMSTASSFLNSIIVIIIKDVITPSFPQMANNNKQLMLARYSGMIIALAAFGMLFVKDQIIDMMWTMNNLWLPCISIPLVMGVLGIRIKHKNFKYVIISAGAAVLVARAFNGSFDTVTLCAGVFVSALMMLVFRDRSITNTSMSPENIANEIKQDEEVLILNT